MVAGGGGVVGRGVGVLWLMKIIQLFIKFIINRTTSRGRRRRRRGGAGEGWLLLKSGIMGTFFFL